MKSNGIKKGLVGTAALLAAVTLAACGTNKSASSESNTSNSSVTHTSAYDRATKQIAAGKYQAALDTLNDSGSTSTKTKNLASDLRNYISAKSAYDEGNYDQALTNLSAAKSGNMKMEAAFQALRAKITKATSSSESVTNSASSVSETSSTTSASSSVANAAAANSTSESVISQFASKMGFSQQGYGIIPVSQNGDVYRFEVRQSNADNTVANLIGIYDYNADTGAVTQIS